MTSLTDITLDLASPGDATALTALGKATFVETFGHLYKPEDLQGFLEENHTAQHYQHLIEADAWQVWLARVAGEPVGYAVAGPCTLPVDDLPSGAGEIKRLYILSAFQSSGLGGVMMDQMMNWLACAGFHPLYLSVYAENHGAQRFYARYGFEVIQRYEFMVGNHRDPELIMKCRDVSKGRM